MDANHDFEEAVFRFRVRDYEYYTGELPEYTEMTVSGIHRAVIESDIDKAKRCIESGESINKKESQYGYSSLHLAVMSMTDGFQDKNLSWLQSSDPYANEKMLEFLLAQKGLELDSRCSNGWTPLYLATSFDDFDNVEKLIEAGADVNASDDEDDRPLHVAVHHWAICNLLLEHGAVIRTDDRWKYTMHWAIRESCSVDLVLMLLYYNLDANVPDYLGFTPFMTALSNGRKDVQEALFEYVDDFDRINYNDTMYCGSILSYALQSNSPFVKDIIERGADVNYADYVKVMDIACAFLACVHYDVDLDAFKMVWERLRFNEAENTIDLLGFLSYVSKVPTYLSVIIESDNFEVAVRFFSKDDNYFLFVNKYAEKELELEQLTTLTCRLLQNGFCATSYDIGAVFSHYGYCELFRILLYMDNDLTRGWLPSMVLPRLIFDVGFNLEAIIDDVEDIPKKFLIQLLEYSIYPRLIDALTLRYSEDEDIRTIINSFPRVPSLIQLARNAARKQIWRSFKVANTCQFYTVIDHFEIPTLYKDILTFQMKLYTIKQ